MNYQFSADFARTLDASDNLSAFRDRFLIPRMNGKEIIYLCGNSLGLQPKAVRASLDEQLNNWENLAVEGWFEGDTPWMTYHKDLQKLLAPILGAKPAEVAPMN